MVLLARHGARAILNRYRDAVREGNFSTIAAARRQRNQAVVISLKRCFPSGDPPPAMSRRSKHLAARGVRDDPNLEPPQHCHNLLTIFERQPQNGQPGGVK
jgi:hypothetical protein